MIKLWVLVLLLAVASTQGRSLLEDSIQACDGEKGCGKVKTPKYEVVGHHGATEIRQYENSTWAVSVGRSIFGIDAGAIVASKYILGYFSGFNNKHEQIPRSKPVVSTLVHKHPPHPHPHHNGSHPEPPHNGSHPHPPHPPHHPPHPHGPPLVMVGAYVSTKGEAPKPDDHRVKLIHLNSTKIYTHEFGGWAISWFLKKEIKHLEEDLKDLGIKPCKGKFSLAVYDRPLKLFGRRNEIWWIEQQHHHNKTEEDFRVDLSEMIAFEQFDPAFLFPEEMDAPPKPEDKDLSGDLVSMDVLDESKQPGIYKEEATWSTTNGINVINEVL